MEFDAEATRTTTRRRRRAPIACALLAAALLAPGCASGEPWAFTASREAYDAGSLEDYTVDEDPASACAVAIILLLPIAIDLVCLPVTVPHDFVVHGTPW